MAHPVAEDPEPNRTDLMRWLRVNLLPSVFTRESVTPGNGSDDSKTVSNSPPSGTDTQSSYVTSPPGSVSTFEDPAVACEVPHCESSSLTQHCPKMEVDLPGNGSDESTTVKVDFLRYGEEPENLTARISRTEDWPYTSGGYANIWKCILKSSFLWNGTEVSPQDVAVKALIARSRTEEDIKKLTKDLRKEVFVWQQLEHSYIVPLYGIANGFEAYPALVCPWMKHGCLGKYLDEMWRKQQQPPEMHRLFFLLLQVVSGLQYLHSKDIVHGDLMPPNVLINGNGDVRLADFGLSRLLGEHNTSFFASHKPGAIRWAAPEIIPLDHEKCASQPNKASDIYSFGCIMMQVLSGHPPYFNKSDYQVSSAISEGTPPTRPQSPVIADDHWYYIEQCWSKQIEMRPSVDQVLDYIKGEHDKFKQS